MILIITYTVHNLSPPPTKKKKNKKSDRDRRILGIQKGNNGTISGDTNEFRLCLVVRVHPKIL